MDDSGMAPELRPALGPGFSFQSALRLSQAGPTYGLWDSCECGPAQNYKVT